jgi:kumamolisin
MNSNSFRKIISLALAGPVLGIAACHTSSPQPYPGAGCPTRVSGGTVSSAVSIPGPSLPRKAGQNPLHSHIPRAIQNYSDTGKLGDAETLSLTLALNLNNEAELETLIANLYNPRSPGFHRFLTPDDFRARFAPTADQIRVVQDYLGTQGIAIGSIDDNGYLIHVEAPVRAINALFQTEIHHFRNSNGRNVFAPAYELQVPAGSPIRGVHGLHNLTEWKAHSRPSERGPSPEGSSPTGGLGPIEIRTAYQTPSGVTGAGQTLALFELDGYTASDIAGYNQTFGLPNVPLQNVLVSGATGAPGQGAGEVTLDIELMIALAPGAAKIIVYEGPNSNQGVLATYARIASDNLAKNVSTSWGAPEASSTTSFLESENTIFKQMAAQGQSIFAASGDSGALDNGSALGVDDPASQPYVTGVGGTRLFTGLNGVYDHETTWNRDNTASGGAGGGGISTIWSQPTYQNGIVSAASLGSGSARNVPDVSLNSDPATGYAIFFQNKWQIFGGTSCAAPLWAAFTALVNESRASKGLASLGFANTILYQIGKSTNYSLDFSDIQDGSTNIHYPAVAGYDDATGLGSFKGQSLFNDLSIDGLVLTPAPPPSATPPPSKPPTPPGC